MTYISRIVKLKGFRNVLVGRDLGEALEDGKVYGVQNVLGVITLVELGDHALPYGDKHAGHKFSVIAMEGAYCLTKEEYKNQLKKDGL